MSVDCKHHDGRGCCLGLYGGNPSAGVCLRACKSREPGLCPDRGLGDTVARVLEATGVGPLAKAVIERATGKPCGCQERQAALNRLVPFGRGQG